MFIPRDNRDVFALIFRTAHAVHAKILYIITLRSHWRKSRLQLLLTNTPTHTITCSSVYYYTILYTNVFTFICIHIFFFFSTSLSSCPFFRRRNKHVWHVAKKFKTRRPVCTVRARDADRLNEAREHVRCSGAYDFSSATRRTSRRTSRTFFRIYVYSTEDGPVFV